MEEIIGCLRRKSQLIYDINCIKKYIEGGDYDKSLENTWEKYKVELAEIDEKIEEIKLPQLNEFDEKKQNILTLIKEHEAKVKLLKRQLKDLDKIMIKITS